MIYNNILDAIGHTPLIQLQRIVTPDMARVLVKFEGLNVGGSIKTRTHDAPDKALGNGTGQGIDKACHKKYTSAVSLNSKRNYST